MNQSRAILVTGGSGFLGHALIEHLLKNNAPAFIRCLGRDEGKLLETQRKFGVQIALGDVAEFGAVQTAMSDIQEVYHLAGFKHLPLAEKESERAIRTNVIGTMNVLEAAALEGVEMVLGVSTDKAYNPINCYGMTKRLMEYLFADYERRYPDITFHVVRYGNVLGSTGSVIEVWRDAAKRGEKIRVTDLDMTRFFFSVKDAVQTIVDCIEQPTTKGAGPFVPKMKAVRMGDMADVFCTIAANLYGRRPEMESTGLRPGEKTSEGLADDVQSDSAPRYNHDEIYGLIRPLL